MLMINALLPCETQNLASSDHPICSHYTLQYTDDKCLFPSWDARFCVSTFAARQYEIIFLAINNNGVRRLRRKILRLPINPSPTFMHYNMLMINAILPRETQDFASLLCAGGGLTWTGEYTSDIAFLPHYRLLNPIAHCRCHVVKRFLLMLSVISYIKAPTDLSDGSGWCGWNITVCRRMEK